MDRTGRRVAVIVLVVVLTLLSVVAMGAPSAAVVGPETGAAAPGVAVGPPSRASGVPAARGRWQWPLRPQPVVLAPFDPPAVDWAVGHRGVDLAATVGQDVLAPADGVVTFAGVVVDRGVMVVAMPSGLRATFEPVDGSVSAGTTVTAGESVGRVAATPGHCAPITCLHWGVLRDDVYLDPLALVGATRVILLPLTP